MMQATDATTGVIHVHSSPSALCPHVDWAIAATLGCRSRVRWSAQPAAGGELCATINWVGPVGTGARLARSLAVWEDLRFEVTEDASEGIDGERFCHTPALGLWRGTMSANGDTVIGEMRLRAIMAERAHDLAAALDEAMGTDWDDELEPFRFAGDGAEVTWISRRVG
ncbi:DUF3145 domain-containing protein [Lolliginicoccus suaedae]|uniref:DUF3145 domain-containing protein n=1 Tax=Lolliginicoccus suaedae TaxID=2605429 RepID=UPI0011F0686A|nr:DUF3145 domain-containing protein [Lolliginicoccus suaedae]